MKGDHEANNSVLSNLLQWYQVNQGPRSSAYQNPQVLALDLATHPAVYEPAEDSYLLASAAVFPFRGSSELLEGLRMLDLGCGSGLVGLWAALHGARVTAVDLNPHAIDLTTNNARKLGLAKKLEVQLGDLYEAISVGTTKFDIIVCNPPYLPEEPERRTGMPGPNEDPGSARWQAVALEAGPDGGAVAREVLTGGGNWLRSTPKRSELENRGSKGPKAQPGLYLLTSSLTGLKDEDWCGWQAEVVAQQGVGAYETLQVHHAISSSNDPDTLQSAF